MKLHIDELRKELLEPARSRYEELTASIAALEKEVERTIRARDFDELEVEHAQVRLEDLRRTCEAWRRRLHYLEGAKNGKTADDLVAIEEKVA